MANKFYVYAHYRPDGTVFYVGKGSGNRAYDKQHRNKHWKNIVNKCGHSVKIWAKDLTEETAFAMEKEWILLYGRRDLGTGCLVNMTDGGEGQSGIVRSLETRKKLSILASQRVGQRVGHWKGKNLSESTRKKLSEAGRRTCSKGPVRCKDTNAIYPSAKEAERVTGISNISCVCKGLRKSAGGLSWEFVKQ